MRTSSGRRDTLASAITSVTATSSFMTVPKARAEGFIDDSTLTGGIYYWQRERDHKGVTDGGKYKTNLSHSTWNVSLDFQSGYAADMLGLNIAALMAVEMAKNGDSSHPNGTAFSESNKAYDEDWSGDKSGISLCKAAAKFKYGPVQARVGYTQLTGQTLLASHWSFMPGTYQGVEARADFDYGDASALSLSYMWTNEYKAPRHLEMDEFYQSDKTTKVDYLHSLGAKYDFKNSFVLEAALGRAEGYTDQYFAKVSYKFDTVSSPLTTSYQFCGTRDRVDGRNVNDLYDGAAWLQALTFGYQAADVADLHLEGTWVKVGGQQEYSLQRMTPTYASPNGCLDIWWGNRSDFNTNSEKAAPLGAMYDLKNWNLSGFATGAPCVYAWNAKPAIRWNNSDAYYNRNQTTEEPAYDLDAVYTIQDGHTKGTMFRLHLTEYDSHSDISSWSDGHGNTLQDECDMKSMAIASFIIFRYPTW